MPGENEHGAPGVAETSPLSQDLAEKIRQWQADNKVELPATESSEAPSSETDVMPEEAPELEASVQTPEAPLDPVEAFRAAKREAESRTYNAPVRYEPAAPADFGQMDVPDPQVIDARAAVEAAHAAMEPETKVVEPVAPVETPGPYVEHDKEVAHDMALRAVEAGEAATAEISEIDQRLEAEYKTLRAQQSEAAKYRQKTESGSERKRTKYQSRLDEATERIQASDQKYDELLEQRGSVDQGAFDQVQEIFYGNPGDSTSEGASDQESVAAAQASVVDTQPIPVVTEPIVETAYETQAPAASVEAPAAEAAPEPAVETPVVAPAVEASTEAVPAPAPVATEAVPTGEAEPVKPVDTAAEPLPVEPAGTSDTPESTKSSFRTRVRERLSGRRGGSESGLEDEVPSTETDTATTATTEAAPKTEQQTEDAPEPKTGTETESAAPADTETTSTTEATPESERAASTEAEPAPATPDDHPGETQEQFEERMRQETAADDAESVEVPEGTAAETGPAEVDPSKFGAVLENGVWTVPESVQNGDRFNAKMAKSMAKYANRIAKIEREAEAEVAELKANRMTTTTELGGTIKQLDSDLKVYETRATKNKTEESRQKYAAQAAETRVKLTELREEHSRRVIEEQDPTFDPDQTAEVVAVREKATTDVAKNRELMHERANEIAGVTRIESASVAYEAAMAQKTTSEHILDLRRQQGELSRDKLSGDEKFEYDRRERQINDLTKRAETKADAAATAETARIKEAGEKQNRLEAEFIDDMDRVLTSEQATSLEIPLNGETNTNATDLVRRQLNAVGINPANAEQVQTQVVRGGLRRQPKYIDQYFSDPRSNDPKKRGMMMMARYDAKTGELVRFDAVKVPLAPDTNDGTMIKKRAVNQWRSQAVAMLAEEREVKPDNIQPDKKTKRRPIGDVYSSIYEANGMDAQAAKRKATSRRGGMWAWILGE